MLKNNDTSMEKVSNIQLINYYQSLFYFHQWMHYIYLLRSTLKFTLKFTLKLLLHIIDLS